ncbi:MAG: Rieske 2Fe-2S domain-containing protein [Archangiaceae bacterium]|nr:Rieske 2Fe-2S domain-containing protein [Archangiaceae bacterium]
MGDVLRWFHPVLKATRLGRGRPQQVLVNDAAYALWRDGSGRACAVADACPHRFAPLSQGRVRPDGRLACGYHGWHFDGEGNGVSPSNATQAKCDTRALRVEEKYGWLWVCSRESTAELPTFEREGHRFTGAFSMRMPAPLHVALDNFSENEHVPFVHTRLGWDDGHLEGIEFEAENFDDSTTVKYRAEQRWSPLLRLFDLAPGDRYHNEWVTRFDPVRTEYTIFWSKPDGARRPFVTRSTIYMVPETAKTTWFHVFITTHLEGSYPLRAWLFRAAALGLGWWEVRDDAKFLPQVADVTPAGRLTGKLGRFDKPVIHNRKLLEGQYFGEAAGVLPSGLRIVP